MNKKVFVSYSSEDSMYANILTETLKRKGIQVFGVQDRAANDEYFNETLKKELLDASAVIPLISENWVKSKRAGVQYGASSALEKTIIPILIEDIPKDIPITMYRHLNGQENDVDVMVEEIEKIIQNENSSSIAAKDNNEQIKKYKLQENTYNKSIDSLKVLLRHNIQELYSAEEQIIDVLPTMINRAFNPQLKQAHEEQLRVTDAQRDRLLQVRQHLEEDEGDTNDSGFFAGPFGSGFKCKGMEGLIDEVQKVMGEDMAPEVMDAAIIASVQKIEHYEICGYGTACTYAQQLGLNDVAQLLQQTLYEEHDADDRLTAMAVGDLNQQAATGDNINRVDYNSSNNYS